jgi:hypothetical protein
MSRTVSGEGGTIRFSKPQYGLALKMAFDRGWKPRGTIAPTEWGERPEHLDKYGNVREWPVMNYFAGMGERVSDEDAADIARVLGAVMDDIPDHDALAHKVLTTVDLPYHEDIRLLKPGAKVNMFEFFSGKNKELLRRFVDLCGKGGFEIRRST